MSRVPTFTMLQLKDLLTAAANAAQLPANDPLRTALAGIDDTTTYDELPEALRALLQKPISSLAGSDAALARALLAAQGLILEPGTPYYTGSDPATLHAVWEPVTYNITFNKNDGVAKGSMASQSYTYGEEGESLFASKFSRRNAKFLGWAFSPDATTPELTEQQLLDALTAFKRAGLVAADATIDDPNTAMFLLAAMAGFGNQNITLYAVWDIETHKATLAGGTTRVDEETGHIISVATYEGGTVTIDSEAIEPGFTLSRDAVKIEPAEGYYLKGWYVTINGVTTYYEDPDAIFNIIMDADVVFEPVWGNYAEDEAARLRAMPQNTLANTGDPIEALPFAIIAIVALIALVAACRKLRSRDE